MVRPRTPIGAHGEITAKPDGDRWVADTRYRMRNGATQRVRRWRKTKTAAENAVKEACAELAKVQQAGKLSRDTPWRVVADKWLAEVEHQVAQGEASPNSVRNHRSVLKNWINPHVGELTMWEQTVAEFDALLVNVIVSGKSKETRANVKKALLGVCGYAVRHGLMDVNMARLVARAKRDTDTADIVALTVEQRVDLLAKVRAYCAGHTTTSDGRALGKRAAIWLALPDLIVGMLATGVRIGEVLALAAEDVTVDDDGRLMVTIGHHLVSYRDRGLVRVPGRKNGQPALYLGVPSWSESMWTRRAHQGAGDAPLFPDARGGWLDPSNVGTRIRAVFGHEDVGYGWVTSKLFRKTVTGVLQDAGLPTTVMADQLGNTTQVVEKHYRPKRRANPDAVAALEHMMGIQDGQ